MILDIGGLDLKHHDEIQRACHFFMATLCQPHRKKLYESVNVRIEFKNRFADEGCVEWTDRRVKPRHFVVELKKKNLRETLKTLAHEFTHIYQYATGDMTDVGEGVVLFKKNKYKQYQDDDLMNAKLYYRLPWEIDAQGWEISLYQLYYLEYHQKLGKMPNYSLRK